MWGALAILAALSCVAVAFVLARQPRWAPGISALAALAVAAILALAWHTGVSALADLAWMSPLGSRLSLALDPLAAPIAIFLTALAAPILAYTGGYLPRHLARDGRPLSEQGRFCALMLAFMAAMVLLVIAQDLLVILAALELTALASFLLIEFDRHDPAARRAATLALAVTMGSSLVFLVGALWIAAQAGSTVIADLTGSDLPPLSLACLAIGALGKSAQVPLHFWLPRAMVAPTPVSAYLHSATLVAAGVFVLMRVRVLLASSTAVLDGLIAVGFVSIALGAALALVEDELKAILAYSTVAQYGYALVLVGVGGDSGLAGAPLFLVAHGVCKSALFLTAGAVTASTGAERLSELGGLARRMPLLALSSGVAAAGLAGVPLTVGYFKDEVLLAAASDHGALLLLFTSAAIALTLAYTARFWAGIFLSGDPGGLRGRGGAHPGPVPARGAASPRRPEPQRRSVALHDPRPGPRLPRVEDGSGRPAVPPGRALVWPVALLALVVILAGVFVEPLRLAFEDAGSVVAGRAVSFDLRYRLALRPELLAALGAWVGGVALFATRARWEPALRSFAGRASALGPARLADGLARGARFGSDALHRLEIRDLRGRVGAVLVPTAVLVGLALVPGGGLPAPTEALDAGEVALTAALAVMSLAAVIAARPDRHFAIVLQLSFVGFSLALALAMIGASEVALVIALVETLFTLLFLGVLSRVRDEVLVRALGQPRRVGRSIGVALVAGGAASVVAWVALSAPPHPRVADAHLGLAERAHAADAVTAVLADFRGLDTAGELTVLTVAILGAVAIARGVRP